MDVEELACFKGDMLLDYGDAIKVQSFDFLTDNEVDIHHSTDWCK